jgi:hypothetical protein
MHGGVADTVAAHQLVLLVHVDVIFVAEVALAMLFRPAGIGVLLAALGWLVGPVLLYIAGLNGLVLIAGVVIVRHRGDGRI